MRSIPISARLAAILEMAKTDPAELWDKTANLKLAGRHVGLPAFLESLKLTGPHGNSLFKSADDMSDAELKAALLAAAEKL